MKYYQREGLLPPGEKTAPNQATYGTEHVARVRLVRALLGTGGLSVAAAKEVVAALDAAPIATVFETAQRVMSAPRSAESDPSPQAEERVLALLRSLGWQVDVANPGIAAAARALDGLAAAGHHPSDEYLRAYADAATRAATADLRALAELTDPTQTTELMVVGTVLGDSLLLGLRRLAHQDATSELFPVAPVGDETAPANQHSTREEPSLP